MGKRVDRAIVTTLAATLAVALAACEPDEQAQVAEVCGALCDCAVPFGGSNAECRAGCTGALATVSDVCVACAREAACHEIFDCLDACMGGSP